MALPATTEKHRWQWPINVALYDRAIELTPSEHSVIARLLTSEWKCWRWTPDRLVPLDRLVRPIADAFAVTRPRSQLRAGVLKILMLETGRFGRTLWGWTRDEWLGLLRDAFAERYRPRQDCRQHIIATMYLLGCSDVPRMIGRTEYVNIAAKVFGRQAVDMSLRRITDELRKWGFSNHSFGKLQATLRRRAAGTCGMDSRGQLRSPCGDLWELPRQRTPRILGGEAPNAELGGSRGTAPNCHGGHRERSENPRFTQ